MNQIINQSINQSINQLFRAGVVHIQTQYLIIEFELLVVLTIYCYILDLKLTNVYTPGPTGHIRLYSISYNNNNLCFTKYNYNNIKKY